MQNRYTKDNQERKRLFARLSLGGGIIGCVVIIFLMMERQFEFGWVSQYNEVGDAIGGITAPIVGILSALLIYFSFDQQLIANKIQYDAIQSELKLANSRHTYEHALTQLDIVEQLWDEFYKQDWHEFIIDEFYDSTITKANEVEASYIEAKQIIDDLLTECEILLWLMTKFNMVESDLIMLFSKWNPTYSEILPYLGEVMELIKESKFRRTFASTEIRIKKLLKSQSQLADLVRGRIFNVVYSDEILNTNQYT